MNTVANVHAYTKNISSIMFNAKKPKNVVEVKKESNLVKLCYAKYKETKNTSCAYIKSISNKIKDKTSNVLARLSFFKFNENCKYTNFPWYVRLYLILKDNINQLIEYKNNETPVNVSVIPSEVVQNGDAQSEKQTSEKKIIEENTAYGRVTNYDFNIQNSYSASYSKRQLSSPFNRHFKRTNSERLVEKDNNFNGETSSYSNRIALSAKNGTISIINSFMSLNKSSPVVVTNEKNNDIEKTIELVETNEKEEINIIAEIVSENVTDIVSEIVSENVAEIVSENVTEIVSENVAEIVSENVTEIISENVVENVSENVSDNVTENVVENISENVAEIVSENVAEKAITEIFITEEVSKPNEMNLSIIEKNGLTTGIKQNFKNAWSTFNNFIA